MREWTSNPFWLVCFRIPLKELFLGTSSKAILPGTGIVRPEGGACVGFIF